MSKLDPDSDLEVGKVPGGEPALYKSHSDPEVGGVEQNTGGKENR